MSRHPGTLEVCSAKSRRRRRCRRLRRRPVLRVADTAVPAPVDHPAASDQPTARKSSKRRLLLAGAGLLALTGAIHFGWEYWTVGRFQVSTDDAYVQADNSTIAPKVSGYIAAVLVGDNEQVKAGQLLARIDDRDFATALAQANADVAAAEAAVASKAAALDTQQSVIDAARATVAV